MRAQPLNAVLSRIVQLVLCFALVGLMLAAGPVVAQSSLVAAGPERYQWKPVAIGGGGFITGLSADLSGMTRVARADVYGAYLWLPNEDRWAQMVTTSNMPADLQVQNAANDGVFEVVVAPSDPDRIYMAFKGGVYRTNDRAISFVRTAPLGGANVDFDANSSYRANGPFMAVDPKNPDLVMFATPSNGLWRSANGGSTWTQVPLPRGKPPGGGGCGVLWFAPEAARAQGEVWTVLPGYGVYVSADGGMNFKPLPNRSGESPKYLGQGAFAPNGTFFSVDPTTRKVWRYRAGAWTDLTVVAGLPSLRYTTLAVNPHTSQVFVLDEGGSTFVSNNSGANWRRLHHRSHVGKGDPPWLHVSDQSYFAIAQVHFDPAVPSRLWAATGTGVYYADVASDQQQLDWTSQTRGIEELVANDVIKPPGQAAMFAAWDFGIHVKVDLDKFSSTYGPKERVLIAAQQLAWSALPPGFVVTNASDTRTNCCSEDGSAVLAGYSLDGGRSWTKFATLPHPPGTHASDPWRMSFGSIAVSVNDSNNIVWAPSLNRSPYYSKDRGRNWTRVSFSGEILPLTGSHSAYHFHRKTLAADRVSAGVFYLVHSGEGANAALAGLWRSQNGGTTWSRVFQGEIAPRSQGSAKLRVMPDRAGHLFFTSGVYGPFDTKLRRSRDGGISWSSMPEVDQVEDVAFGRAAEGAPYPTIFVAGRVANKYGIWRSVDDGVRWQRIGGFTVGSLDQVTVIEGDPDVFGRVYLGFKGSGWTYGQPATCTPTTYQFPANRECVAVR